MSECIDVWMYRCKDEWMNGCIDAWMYGWMDVRMNGCKDEWMNGCMDVRMNGRIETDPDPAYLSRDSMVWVEDSIQLTSRSDITMNRLELTGNVTGLRRPGFTNTN